MERRKMPSLVSVLILTLITAVMWVAFDVFRLIKKPQPSSVPEEISAPLVPSLDEATIRQIETAIYLSGDEIPDDAATGIPVTAPKQETPIAEASPSASVPPSENTPVP